MLYERWRHLAGASSNIIALSDLSNGTQWSFRELAAAAEAAPIDGSPIAFPQTASVEFILTLLRAWRGNQITCPLEPGQPEPSLQGGLPAGIAHFKTTSATTGRPRLVAFTAAQLMADADNIVLTMGLRRDWPNLG